MRRACTIAFVVSSIGCSYPDFEFVAASLADTGVGVDATVAPADGSAVPDTVVVEAAEETEVVDTKTDAGEDGTTDDTLDIDTTLLDSGGDATVDASGDAAVDASPDVRDTATDTRDAADTAPVYVYLVGFGNTWKYRDDNNVPGTTWTGGGAYDDTNWKSGPAPLGYGNNNEATVVGYGGDAGAKYTTTWFRKSTNVADETKYDQLRVRLRRDDGAVVYLNGVEIARSNMPSGTITATTYSSSTINDESIIYQYTVSVAPLKTGTNVLAVEIHQSSGTSSDIYFDIELTARLAP